MDIENYNNLEKEKNKIEELIEKAQDKNSADKAIELMENNNLLENKDYCKEILKFAFEKNIILSRFLYNKFKIINWDSEEEKYKEDLVNIAINTNSKRVNQVFGFLLENFSDEINKKTIEQLFNIYKKNTTNVVLGRYFIKKLSEKNNPMLKCTNMKDYENLIKSIIRYSNNVELFEKYYSEYKTNYSTEYKSNITSFLKEIFINDIKKDPKDEKSIVDCTLKDESNLPSNLLKELLKIDKAIDIESLNKVISKSNPSKLQNIIEITKIGKQGKGQIKKIDRNITCDGNSIKTIKDKVITNLIDGTEKKLYEVTYDAEGNQEIIYYEKDEKKILAIIKIDKNEELKFESEKEGKEATYNPDEIKRILNDNYNSIDYFDYKISYLSYIPLKDNENIIFKANCKSIEDIVKIVEENKNSETIAICDFTIDGHTVQIAIENNEINILNTGFNFKYIVKEIEKKYKGIKIRQIKTIEQNGNNCVEASKLYTVVLAEKYKKHFKSLKNLFERFSKFEKFMEDILNKTEEEQANYIKESEETKKEYKENLIMLKIVLETNVELFNKYKKHFKDSVEELKKVELKNEIISIINLKNEIDNKLNKNNKKYGEIIKYIVKNSKENSKNKEENRLKNLKLSRIILRIIRSNIYNENIKIIDNKEQNIVTKVNECLKNKKKEKVEQVFKKCIEEIGDLTVKELEL